MGSICTLELIFTTSSGDHSEGSHFGRVRKESMGSVIILRCDALRGGLTSTGFLLEQKKICGQPVSAIFLVCFPVHRLGKLQYLFSALLIVRRSR